MFLSIGPFTKYRNTEGFRMSTSDFYLRYYVGHKGKFGHEFLEFEFRPDGELVRPGVLLQAALGPDGHRANVTLLFQLCLKMPNRACSEPEANAFDCF